jgi:hypothetical protein
MRQQYLFFRLRFGKTEKVYSLEFISNSSFQPQVKIDQLALKYLSSIFYFWNRILLFWQFEMLFSISSWSWIIVLDEPLFFKQAYSILNKNLFSFLVFQEFDEWTSACREADLPVPTLEVVRAKAAEVEKAVREAGLSSVTLLYSHNSDYCTCSYHFLIVFCLFFRCFLDDADKQKADKHPANYAEYKKQREAANITRHDEARSLVYIFVFSLSLSIFQ